MKNVITKIYENNPMKIELIGILFSRLLISCSTLAQNTQNKNYLDLMREHGPGKYILTANTPDRKTYKIDLEFTD